MIIDIFKNKIKRCFNKNMKWHNAYGPDETRCTGYKTYCINNNFHNLHGPAAIYPDDKNMYYLDNICHTKEEWKIKRYDY